MKITSHSISSCRDTFQCWAILRVRDKYPSVISQGIYSPICQSPAPYISLYHQFSKVKEPSLVFNYGSQSKTNSQRTDQRITVLSRFFHETCPFFKGFERTGACDSWLLKYWKNRNWRFLKIQRTAQHWSDVPLLCTFGWKKRSIKATEVLVDLRGVNVGTIAGRQRVVVGVCAATRERERERVGEWDTAQSYGGYGQSFARRRRYIIPFFLPIPACRAPSSHPMLRQSRPPSACSCCSHPVFSYSFSLPSSSSSSS